MINEVITRIGDRHHCRLKKTDIAAGVFVGVVILSVMCLFIMPMAIKRGSYLFTINDELDSFAGNVQRIHRLHSFFNINKGQTFTGGLNHHYSLNCILQLYTMICCLFGYLDGQIIVRILSVIGGFFSMRLLLQEIYPKRSYYQSILFSLTSCVYAVTSSAPNRQIAFATLPLIIFAFLRLRKTQKYTPYLFLTALYPMVTCFTAIHVFVMMFWAFFTVVNAIMKKKININLCLSFAAMGVSTLIVYKNLLLVSLVADDTNRVLFTQKTAAPHFDWEKYYLLLFSGQYHSTASHVIILLPVLLTLSIVFLVFFVLYKDFRHNNRTSAWIILAGWSLWLASAFVETFQESGYKSGITLIDGFQWGRLVGFMRIGWYLMIGAMIMIKPVEKMNWCLWLTVPAAAYGVRKWMFYHDYRIEDYTWLDYSVVRQFYNPIFFVTVLVGASMLLKKRAVFQACMCGVLCLQVAVLITSDTMYNDVGNNLIKEKIDSLGIAASVDDFFSPDLFETIKEDIDYNFDEEQVAAYGFHTSVLIYNGFNTIDRYVSCHSMRAQEEFRSIIYPALDKYPEYQLYYDGWGGRMYLFGELPYDTEYNSSTKLSPEEKYPLYIDVQNFKKFKGKYILSRAAISNADEIGLEFVNDYGDNSRIYHIYVYKAL